jgi:uncharacterized phage protein gp47/JayE
MAYTPPTIAQSNDQIITDIEGAIGQTVPILPVAFVRALAKALAGVLSPIYRLINWLFKQLSPVTCDLPMLLYWGQWFNLLPKEAHAALLSATVSGTNGIVCHDGTLWQSPDNGDVYNQVGDITISAGVATAQVEDLTEGASGNLSNGLSLTLPSPVAGITGAVVASTIETGVDAEATPDSFEGYRQRVLQRMRYQSIVGTAGGYVAQALQYEGVVKAFAKRSGTDVVVYPLIATSGASRVPSGPTLAAIQTYLQSVSRRALSVTVYAQAATERTVDATITGVSPADAATKATILAAWNACLYAAYPRQYDDEVATTDSISAGSLWAIVLAAGAMASGITINVSGIGGGPYTLPIGELAKPGTLSWA